MYYQRQNLRNEYVHNTLICCWYLYYFCRTCKFYPYTHYWVIISLFYPYLPSTGTPHQIRGYTPCLAHIMYMQRTRQSVYWCISCMLIELVESSKILIIIYTLLCNSTLYFSRTFPILISEPENTQLQQFSLLSNVEV